MPDNLDATLDLIDAFEDAVARLVKANDNDDLEGIRDELNRKHLTAKGALARAIRAAAANNKTA